MLPPAYKLRVLDEKHVLRKAATGLVPQAILERKKQPYRAPDALSFAEAEATDWIEEVASADALAEAGVFNPAAARQLIEKCRSRASAGQFSNADNMGVVGILSTQLVHHHFIRRRPEATAVPHVQTVVDRLCAPLGAM
jgi:asparagine synthase (glutamine-hydrolysing)